MLYHYLETGSTDPYYNLAFEEYILMNKTAGSYLILWQNDNTIVVGQNQNTAAEVNRSFVMQHGIHVVRRTTGGGAVYHDLGNLNYSFISDLDVGFGKAFSAIVVKALCSLGIDAAVSGRNDITIGDQKISGTAQRVFRGRILHHGTLLFDSNLETIAGALNVDPEKFKSKHTKSVRSRVGNIRPFLGKDMELIEFKEYLKTALTDNGFIPETLSLQAQTEIQSLRDTKYATEAWNWGTSLPSTFTNKSWFPAGCLEICTDIVNNHIHNLHFFGDYLSLCSQDELSAALEGCPYSCDAVDAILQKFDLICLFGGITAENILDTLFCRE